MLLRQLLDPETGRFTYLVGDPDSASAALVDPLTSRRERDERLVAELGLRLEVVLVTHRAALSAAESPARRAAARVPTVGAGRGGLQSDRRVAHGDVVRVGSLPFYVLATPGHAADGVSFLVEGHVITGDTLLVRGCGACEAESGDPGELYDSITRVLFSLPDETWVLPGRDLGGLTRSTIGEEKRFNPCVRGVTREAFVARTRPPPDDPPADVIDAAARRARRKNPPIHR